ncbi:protein sarah [Daktulosphaira vitifoliae]|uniref:protein sarah n=1 Tax=Daktulosphaira vitifoliae TaxID=58002 RepID=UPI0021AA2BC2|nr:protein sarah [Daktulosphaira vitifoliae]
MIEEPKEIEDQEIIVNEIDGLPSLHDNQKDLQKALASEQSSLEDLNDEDLPTSLIITNVDPAIFKDDDLKKEIEMMFSKFGEILSVQYFRSFKRIRVNYSTSLSAANARIQMHQIRFYDTVINCYFAQPVTPMDAADQHLQLPAPVKQFLISPPASPPEGWVPRAEGEPLINYDLIAAIASLTPGQPHEIHAPTDTLPGIVLHVAEGYGNKNTVTIPHTRLPDK